MAKDANAIVFDNRELVTAMIRERGLHEGIWALYVEFGIIATNMGFRDPDNPDAPQGPSEGAPSFLFPTAIVPIQKIGLVRADVESPISVDAAAVNPKARSGSARKTPKKK